MFEKVFQENLNNIVMNLAKAAMLGTKIVNPTTIPNKDKLIIVLTVMFPTCASISTVTRNIENIRDSFIEQFDDGSVLVMVVPMYTSNVDQFTLRVKTLNTEKMEPEDVDTLLKRAEDIMKKIKIE